MQISTAAVVIPPFHDFYATPHRFSALGPAIVIKLLKKHCKNVHFFNFPLSENRQLPLPSELRHLQSHIIPGETGGCSFFTKYKRYGPPLIQCSKNVTDISPDIVFVACFAFCYADTAIDFCKSIRQTQPRAIIAIGGAGVSAYPQYFLEHSSINYVLDGEAELTIPQLLSSLQDNLANLQQKRYFSPETLEHSTVTKRFTQSDEIEPVYSLFESNKEHRINITLSRGCPLGCNFCSNYLCHGSSFRHISIASVKDIISDINLQIKQTQKPVSINFEDDNILLDIEFFYKVIYEFKQAFPQATFYTENGIDYRLLTPEFANQLIDLGLSQFNFSLGSINSGILSTMLRSADTDNYKALLQVAKQQDIPVITYFICGHENDTKESIADNLAFLFNNHTIIGISLFYPVPGIEGFTDKAHFKQGNSLLCCGSSAYPWNKSISTNTMVTAFRLARILNCCKSNSINDMERESLHKTFTLKKIHTTIKKNGCKIITEVPLQDVELIDLVLQKIKLDSIFV